MMTYILQSGLFLLAFWLIYILFLKRETFFTYNRIYLLATPILAAILPLLKSNLFETYTEKAQEILLLPAVFIGDQQTEITPENISALSETTFIQDHFFSILYMTGLLLMLAFFVRKLIKFQRFSKNGKATSFENHQLVEVPNTKIACTFLQTIYLGSELSEKEKQHILRHEKTHAKQRHTYDLLYFEILKIISWFNPTVFLYQHEITQVHEYIADQQATKDADKLPYYQSLLNLAFGSSNISFVNQFFNHSLIKKRIKMLEKTKSTRSALLKFLVLVPAILAMLFVVSCTDEAVKETQDSAVAELTEDDWKEVILNNKNSFRGSFWYSEGGSDREITYAELPDDIKKGNFSNYILHINEEGGNKIFDIISYEEFKDPNKLGTGKYSELKVFDLLNEKGAKINDVKVEVSASFDKKTESAEIPFTQIEKAPIYPGCENLAVEEQKKCLAQKISELVNSNFDTSLGKRLGLEGINRVYVNFKINKDGIVENIKARAAHQDLMTEAERVIKLLPQMAPGEHEGKKVGVVYSLPIVFEVK